MISLPACGAKFTLRPCTHDAKCTHFYVAAFGPTVLHESWGKRKEHQPPPLPRSPSPKPQAPMTFTDPEQLEELAKYAVKKKKKAGQRMHKQIKDHPVMAINIDFKTKFGLEISDEEIMDLKKCGARAAVNRTRTGP